MKARVELSRHYEPVTAVVSFSADHHDAMIRERREAGREKFDHALAGVLHQDDARNAALDRETIHFTHACGSQDLHEAILRAISIVISSCNSGEPVQCTTASMAR